MMSALATQADIHGIYAEQLILTQRRQTTPIPKTQGFGIWSVCLLRVVVSTDRRNTLS